GGEQQHQRERDLRHHGNMTRRKETTQPTDSRRFAYLFFEVINEIGLCCLQRRAEAEKHCCNEAKEECHRKHRRVRTQFNDKRKIHGRKHTARWMEYKSVAPGTEDQADG